MQRWRGVIGHRRVRQVALHQTYIVGDAIQRPCRNAGVQRQLKRCGRRTVTRSRIFRRGDLICPIRAQRRGDGQLPATGYRISTHAIDIIAVNVHLHQCARRRAAHNRWGRVIGVTAAAQIAGNGTFIIHDVADGYAVTAGVHDEVDRVGRRADVTRFVFNRDFPGVVAVRQRRCRGVAPVTAAIDRNAHGSAITEIDNSGTARFTFTTVGWGVVIGGVVVTNQTWRTEVVPQFHVSRFAWCDGVHNNDPLAGFRAAVAGHIFCDRAEAVLALRQRRIKLNGPASTGDHRAADWVRVRAVIQIDGGAILRGTGNNRTIVIRDATVLYRANV